MLSIRRQSSLTSFFLTITGILIFLYVAARAWLLDITYDEAWTITRFASTSVRDIFSCTPCDANNHILNTLLIKFFQHLFGDSLFVARLPNLLSLVLYLAFSYKISSRLRPFPRVCLFLLLITNPFILDFFGLARGYGLSLAFVTTAVHFQLKYFRQPRFRTAIMAVVLAALAVLSNFTALYFFMAVGILTASFQLLDWKKTSIEELSLELAIAGVLGLIMLVPVLQLTAYQLLYYGGNAGFYDDTLTSLAVYTSGHPFQSNEAVFYLNIFLGLSLFILAVGLVRKPSYFPSKLFSQKAIALALFALPALISVLFVQLLGNLYLINRTALFLYPLFVIAIARWADRPGKPWARVTSYTALGMLSLMLVLNLVPNINFYKTITWPHDSRTTEILDILQQKAASGTTLNIDASWPIAASLSYHIEDKAYNNLNLVKKERNKVEDDVDYFIFYDYPLYSVGYLSHEHPVLKYSRDTILSFPDEDIWVFSNIAPAQQPPSAD